METSISAHLKDGYQVSNTSEKHTWLSDEPIDLGGMDTGPKPTELLLSSLASCKLITMKMYASRKGWDLKEVSVDLTILETGEKTVVEKKLHFHDDLTPEQKERLTVISGRCPVVKMLKNSIEFKIV